MVSAVARTYAWSSLAYTLTLGRWVRRTASASGRRSDHCAATLAL